MPTNIDTIDIVNPNSRRVTFRLIDRRGDKRAWGFAIPGASMFTNAQLNAFISSYALATNALLYSVEITSVFESLPQINLASNSVFASADAIAGVLFKPSNPDPTQSDIRLEIRAPIGAMILNGEIVDRNNATLASVVDNFDALLSGAGLIYSPVAARFTERRDRNSAVPY